MGGVPSRHRGRKGPRRLPAALLRAGLGILPLAALSGGEAVYTSESHGFRLERPDPAWVFQEKRDAPAGTLALILAPAGGGGLAQVSVRARPLAGETTAEALRDETLASIAGDDAYTLRSRETFTLDGHEAKGFVLDARSGGTTFRVRQCDLVAQGVRYTIECHAPRGDFDEYVRTFDQIWRTFRILPLSEEGRLRQRRLALAAKCGSEIEWGSDWDEVAARARREGKLVLVKVRLQGAFQISDPMLSGPFMDPDVVDLVRERYVALLWRKGMDAPFVGEDSYGMSGSTFGSSLLLVTPEGEVVGDTFSVEATSVEAFLRTHVLAWAEGRAGRVADAAPPPGLSDVERAAWRLRRGELDRALEELDETPDVARREPRRAVAAHRIRAACLRRLRRGKEALAEVRAAREAAGAVVPGGAARDEGARGEEGSGEAAAAADLDAEEGLVLLRLGRFEEAEALFRRALERKAPPSRTGEAAYWLGALRLREGDAEGAGRVWKEMVREPSENRWAWRAAADLESTGFALGIGPRLAWAPDEVYASLRPTLPGAWRPDRTAWSRKAKAGRGVRGRGASGPRSEGDSASRSARAEAAARAARQEAIALLLAGQREDGSWISPPEVGRAPREAPDPFVVAITAIAAKSLLPYRDLPGVDDALHRALTFLLGAREREKSAGERPYFMDYRVWSHAYVLWFLADVRREARAGGALGEGERVGRVMEELVAALGEKQRRGGGWSYYVTMDLSAAATPAEQSISFVTAAVTLSLLAARAAGAPVPPDVLEKALNCLERMRDDRGVLAYMLGPDQQASDASTGAAGAAGRGPLGALALLRGGRVEVGEVRRALDDFLEHRESYAGEVGKTLMHAGTDMQGSHYVLFDYATAAAAVAALSERERSRYRAPLLDLILRARTADGAWVDNPLNGPHYGTAMALQALSALEPLP